MVGLCPHGGSLAPGPRPVAHLGSDDTVNHGVRSPVGGGGRAPQHGVVGVGEAPTTLCPGRNLSRPATDLVYRDGVTCSGRWRNPVWRLLRVHSGSPEREK